MLQTNTAKLAERELDILDRLHPDPENPPLIKEFRNEILALCEKFGNSGQSGGSAPFVARALAGSIEKLCLQEPIAPLTGEPGEWIDHENNFFQNIRGGAVFKGSDGRAYYLDAVIFCGEDEGDQFTGRVENITSRQYIKSFPFTPKKFFIDVVRVKYDPINHAGARVVSCGTGDYVYFIKDLMQVKEVFNYYDKYE
jgi:hypothetical protein